jgi:ABC-type branched-subunit amino acid transport system substrate-binding protein
VLAGLVLFDPRREAGDPAAQPSAPLAARGVGATEIVVGMASPFSGANRELGRDMKAGVEAAFADVNAAGGIHGRKLRLVAVDDGYEPTRTGAAMKQLLEVERVFAVVGNVGTPTAAVAIPISAQHRAVFLGALTGSGLLRNDPPDRWVFNFRPSYAEETAAAVRYLADVRGIRPDRIAVFAQEDGFGESGWEGVARQLGERRVDLSRVVRVGYRRNTADVADAIATVRRRAADVDAVVMIATYKAAATFIRALRDAGLGLLTTNVSPVDSNALAEELIAWGERYAEGVVVTQVVPVPTSAAPGVTRFRAALEKHLPGERAGFLALEGWVVGHILAEGLRRAGADVDPDKLVAALESIRELDLGIGTLISFGPREHQGSHKVWGTILQRDGSWKQIDLE